MEEEAWTLFICCESDQQYMCGWNSWRSNCTSRSIFNLFRMRTHVFPLQSTCSNVANVTSLYHVERIGAALIFVSLRRKFCTQTHTHTRSSREAEFTRLLSSRKLENHMIENVRRTYSSRSFNVRWSLPRMWKCTCVSGTSISSVYFM